MSDLLQSLRPLFEPRHVAIIGASRTPGKRGHTVTRNLLRCGFAGRISPINPGVEEVEGLPCYSSIAAVPEPVDCAFLALPAEQSLDAARQCAAAGVRAIAVGRIAPEKEIEKIVGIVEGVRALGHDVRFLLVGTRERGGKVGRYADRILEIGFEEEMNQILRLLPKGVLAFFSSPLSFSLSLFFARQSG